MERYTQEAVQALTQLSDHVVYTARELPDLALYDGSRGSLNRLGLSVLSQPRSRPTESKWLRRSALSRALREHPSGLGALRFADHGHWLMVQWRTLLSKALLRVESVAVPPAPLRALAHHAWWAAYPIVEQYDVVLADLLKRAHHAYVKQAERQVHEPYWVGIETYEDELRFDAQATYLLAMRQTPTTPVGFCERVTAWFNDAFSDAIFHTEQRDFGLCGTRRHVRGQPCPTCPEVKVDRPFLGIFDGDALARLTQREIQQPGPQGDFVPFDDGPLVLSGPMSQQLHNFRWMLEARSRHDGVARFTTRSGNTSRLIHLPRLKACWQRLGIKSVLDDYDLTTADGLDQAYRYMLGLIGHTAMPPNVAPLEAIYAEAKWGGPADYAADAPYMIAVTDVSLVQRLARLGDKAAALTKAVAVQPRPPAPKGAPQRRSLPLTFQPQNGGPAYQITVVQYTNSSKRLLNFFSTPFTPTGSYLEPRNRAGQGIYVNKALHWTVYALNRLASEKTPGDEPLYPLAREFAAWAAEWDSKLISRRAFLDAIYDAKHGERLVALELGQRGSLGRFTAKEDQIIRDYFLSVPRSRRMESNDWVSLLKLLPGRNQRGVMRRLEELGKEYAFINGFKAYAASPFHRKFSNARKRRWLKEGCPP